MRFTPGFYRTAAVCSLLSALTTFLLIFLPDFYAPAEGFGGRMARVADPAYRLRAWVYLVHPFLVWTAAFAVAVRLRSIAAGAAASGLAAFSLWAASEATQQALTIRGFDEWRTGYLAGEASARATMELRTQIYDALWDALFLVLLIGFLIGNSLYAAAIRRGGALGRALSVLYGAAALLTLTILSNELHGPALPPALDRWLYPAIQPLARALIGVWLWRNRDESAMLDAQERWEPFSNMNLRRQR